VTTEVVDALVARYSAAEEAGASPQTEQVPLSMPILEETEAG
jgi:hypothetical protein